MEGFFVVSDLEKQQEKDKIRLANLANFEDLICEENYEDAVKLYKLIKKKQ